jgi:putative endonuclease
MLAMWIAWGPRLAWSYARSAGGYCLYNFKMLFYLLMFYVYILHSLKDGRLYTGYTADLKSRFSAHSQGFVVSTKNRRPLKLIHYEAFIFESDAKQRESYLKGGNGKKELEIILKHYFKYCKWQK